MSTPQILVYGDVGTALAAAIESYLYRSSVDWMQCSKQAVLGIVSRYVQHYVVSFMPVLTANFSENQKAEFVVFIVSAVYHRIMEKKKSSLLAGFRTASNDLMGSEMVLFLGMDPMSAIIPARGGTASVGSSTSFFRNPFSNSTPTP